MNLHWQSQQSNPRGWQGVSIATQSQAVCHSVSILIAMHWSGPNLNGSIALAQTREEISPRAALDNFLTKFDKVTERGFVKTL